MCWRSGGASRRCRKLQVERRYLELLRLAIHPPEHRSTPKRNTDYTTLACRVSAGDKFVGDGRDGKRLSGVEWLVAVDVGYLAMLAVWLPFLDAQ